MNKHITRLPPTPPAPKTRIRGINRNQPSCSNNSSWYRELSSDNKIAFTNKCYEPLVEVRRIDTLEKLLSIKESSDGNLITKYVKTVVVPVEEITVAASKHMLALLTDFPCYEILLSCFTLCLFKN